VESYICCCIKTAKKKDDDEEDSENDLSMSRNPSSKSLKKPLSEFQRQRARDNWYKLKDHIERMKTEANFLVKFLAEEDEMK